MLPDLVAGSTWIAAGGAGLDEQFECARPDANRATDSNDFDVTGGDCFVNGTETSGQREGGVLSGEQRRGGGR